MNREFTTDHCDVLAALVYARFGKDHNAARAAWTRLLQNPGWEENATALSEWSEMVARGERALRAAGWAVERISSIGGEKTLVSFE